MPKIHLGDTVKDTITGFRGKAVGRTEWLTGCARFIVQPEVDKDGKLPESQTFDEPTLGVIRCPHKNNERVNRTLGGPRPNALQRTIN